MQPTTDFGVPRNPPKLRLSVIVATLNRIEKLRKCVECLLCQNTMLDWELIVVDNGSTDETSTYLEGICREKRSRTQVVTTREGKRGAARARNTGWGIARGDVVAFTDDDCYAPENYADSVVEVFDSRPDIGFAGGRVLLYDPTDYPITIEDSELTVCFKPFTYIAPGEIHGANMAFRRSALERIGGFDVRLGPGTAFPAGEDIDAAAAMLWLGIPGAYDPRMMVYHHHGRKTEKVVKALKHAYDVGRGAYFAKYIMRRDTRAEFIRAWARSARTDWNAAWEYWRLPGAPVREVLAAMRFAFQRDGK
jgi:glycosyltransferase involved in cell wall biosynthesis